MTTPEERHEDSLEALFHRPRRATASSRAVELFSTPLELGLRSLFLLAALRESIDLQRLVVFDYLLVHSGDARGPSSLHPPTPHRAGEILVKRDLLQKGLRLMIGRDLVAVDLDIRGVNYRATELTEPFLQYFDGAYVAQIRERATWVVTRFGEIAESDLRAYVAAHLDQWGGEFVTEAVVRDVAL